MTAEYEPYEIAERHGVGNILRLLWAYALHRASQRLAHRCQRVMAKARFTNVSWAEMPSAKDAYLTDAVRDETHLVPAPWANDISRQPKEEAPASLAPRVIRAETRTESELPLRSAPGSMRMDAAPGKPEPWFRTLQEAHRIQAALEERMPFVPGQADSIHRDTIARDPKNESPLNPDTAETEHLAFVPSLLDERDNHAGSSTKPIEIVMPEGTSQSRENREVPVIEPPGIASAETAAKGSDGFGEREHIHRHIDATQVAMIPKQEHVELLSFGAPEPRTHQDPLTEQTVPLERWPALPQEPDLISQPRRTQRDLPREQDDSNEERPTLQATVYDPPEEAATTDKAVRASRNQQSASAGRRAGVVADYVRAAQHEVAWGELEGAWPTLPEEARYTAGDYNLERHQREQRRWNEQRGLL